MTSPCSPSPHAREPYVNAKDKILMQLLTLGGSTWGLGFGLDSATQCSTLQHSAARCNTMQHTCTWRIPRRFLWISLTLAQVEIRSVLHCVAFLAELMVSSGRNLLRHNATHYNTVQHTTTHYTTVQHTTTHYTTVQHTTTHYTTVQHSTTHELSTRGPSFWNILEVTKS